MAFTLAPSAGAAGLAARPAQHTHGRGASIAYAGYWEIASHGGIFSFNTPFFGSMDGKSLRAPIVGVAADPMTGGYWEVASDGGVFSFNAPFFGSMGARRLSARIVGMVTPSRKAFHGGVPAVAERGNVASQRALSRGQQAALASGATGANTRVRIVAAGDGWCSR
ncbi:MAG: hypothetical protein ACYDEY_04300 [Acidimicrobiales bacterium]